MKLVPKIFFIFLFLFSHFSIAEVKKSTQNRMPAQAQQTQSDTSSAADNGNHSTASSETSSTAESTSVDPKDADTTYKTDYFDEQPAFDAPKKQVTPEKKPIGSKANSNTGNPKKTPLPKKSSKSTSNWQWAIGASYSLDSRLLFPSAKVSSADYSYILLLDKGFSLDVDFRNLKEQDSWGYLFGVAYDFERTLKGGLVSTGSFSIPVTPSNETKLQSTFGYSSLAYRGESYYFLLGLNFNFTKFTVASSSSSSSSSSYVNSLGYGWQTGIGYYTETSFVFELLYRVAWVKGDDFLSAGSSINYGRGEYRNLMLTLKYLF